MTPAKAVHDFFGMNLTQMKAEWMGKDENHTGERLSDLDKQQIANGLLDETLTYEPTEVQVAAAKVRTIKVPGGPDFVIV